MICRMMVGFWIEADGLGSDAPVRLIQWGGTLPSRRRFVQGLTFATFVGGSQCYRVMCIDVEHSVQHWVETSPECHPSC